MTGDIALSEAFVGLEAGYCLWVGAGVTRQVAGGAGGPPLWSDLTAELEEAAGLTARESDDFPTRLGRCAGRLGAGRFRAFLRRRYWTEFCVSLLEEADLALDANRDLPPARFGALAALGQLANPIVNFNVEWLTSILLARPCGPFQLSVANPALQRREPSGRFHRPVQHPHGLADATTVMTDEDYEALQQSLAFGIAVHGAFAARLAIVGMSLDDQYLRRQIEQHRSSIDTIYWFNDDFSARSAAWARRNDVSMVRSPWHAFWAECAALGVETNRDDVLAAWYLAVNVATDEVEGGPLTGLRRLAEGFEECPSGLMQLAERAATRGRESGESDRTMLVHGKPASEIEVRLRQRLIDDGVELPVLQSSYSPAE
jgi:hypothetical protein